MATKGIYDRRRHAAASTDNYVFHHLIPYIGNKRKLLDLIERAVLSTHPAPGATMADLFAGSGVVARFLKRRGFRVVANDWEPYTLPLNICAIRCNAPPPFAALGGYGKAIERLNTLSPKTGWIASHLCPRNDDDYDIAVDRMFFMRKNGMRIDAMRDRILEWRNDGVIDADEEACLLAPLLYTICYASNTSGVFKGFHNGWGGRTATALYRIAADLRLTPAIFHDNDAENHVTRMEAREAARAIAKERVHLVYLDPPYNQHPYASNYHVLNTVTLWDHPSLPPTVTRGTKAAIRRDWRRERRSPYNYRNEAATAYRELLDAVDCRHILTSYSTDGMIPLEEMLAANVTRGRVRLFARAYKRYRVSSQRFSRKPMNVEFILSIDTASRRKVSVDALREKIMRTEEEALARHRETGNGEGGNGDQETRESGNQGTGNASTL